MSATVATMRILVVEDDKLLSEGLVSVLSRAGHAVDYTASGKYADTLLGQESYDLLVLDVGLPTSTDSKCCGGFAHAIRRSGCSC